MLTRTFAPTLALALLVSACGGSAVSTSPPVSGQSTAASPASPVATVPSTASPQPVRTPEPTLSPSDLQGRMLFARAGGDFGDATIYTANVDGSADTRVGGFLADKTTCCPRWLPDGRHLAFVALAPDGRFTTAITEADGSHVRFFKLPGRFNAGCNITRPTSDRLACEASFDDQPDSYGVYTVSAQDGSDPRAVVTGKGLYIPTDMSPDGKQLVFIGDPVGSTTGVDLGAPVGTLYVINVDGSGR